MTNDGGARAVVVMGVCGVGKSSVAREAAEVAGGRCVFVEGDALHPEANREKMRKGRALTDCDRLPWLESVRAALEAATSQGCNVVATCSALKAEYRNHLLAPLPCGSPVLLAYLHAPEPVLAHRLSSRQGHFFPPTLLQSQLDSLEPPTSPALSLDTSSLSPKECADAIAALFSLR